MNTKGNIHYRATDLLLKQTMWDLLNEQEFSSITVQKICSRAHINRSTFYAHFDDVYDLLNHIDDSIGNWIEEQCHERQLDNDGFWESELPVTLLEHIRKESQFFELRIADRGSTALESFLSFLYSNMQEGGADSEAHGFAVFTSCFWAIVWDWMQSGFKESEREVAHSIRCYLERILMPYPQARPITMESEARENLTH
jgi:AcrR family transcriptional regulator